MHIAINERFRPFCHLPGTSTILPGFGYQVQIFPCLIRIFHLNNKIPSLLTELKLGLKGPIEQFTLFNDLEKGRITVCGYTTDGWIRYHIISSSQDGACRLLIEKGPSDGVLIEEGGRSLVLRDKEFLDLFQQSTSFDGYVVPACERLFLGNHKAQDFEMIRRRFDLAEILPLLHRLGQLVPQIDPVNSHEAAFGLLHDCRDSLLCDHPEKAEKNWLRFLRGAFHGLLVPQVEDCDYQGFVTPFLSNVQDTSPLSLLTEGFRLTRQLFFRQDGRQLFILPCLFPSLHCGRIQNIALADGGALSLEWTKKTIRRLVLSVGKESEYSFKFRPGVRSYRLSCGTKEKKVRLSCNTPVVFKENCQYLFDNFE